jgi:DNA-binding CsgD family transcriptional regulator
MERNDIMMLNNLVYQLYETDNLLLIRQNLLRHLQALVPYSYGSILLSDLNPLDPHFTDPVCIPAEFTSVEEKYIKMAQKDHTLWTIDSGYSTLICESKMLPDHKRLNSPIYQECYSPYHIYDSLQLNIAYNNHFLGALTLYRTKEDGAFTDDETYYVRMIGYHLNRIFYRILLPSDHASSQNTGALIAEQYSLTSRETEIFSYLMSGKAEAEIASSLGISPSTLKKHMQHIYRKLGISTRWELLKFI